MNSNFKTVTMLMLTLTIVSHQPVLAQEEKPDSKEENNRNVMLNASTFQNHFN